MLAKEATRSLTTSHKQSVYYNKDLKFVWMQM